MDLRPDVRQAGREFGHERGEVPRGNRRQLGPSRRAVVPRSDELRGRGNDRPLALARTSRLGLPVVGRRPGIRGCRDCTARVLVGLLVPASDVGDGGAEQHQAACEPEQKSFTCPSGQTHCTRGRPLKAVMTAATAARSFVSLPPKSYTIALHPDYRLPVQDPSTRIAGMTDAGDAGRLHNPHPLSPIRAIRCRRRSGQGSRRRCRSCDTVHTPRRRPPGCRGGLARPPLRRAGEGASLSSRLTYPPPNGFTGRRLSQMHSFGRSVSPASFRWRLTARRMENSCRRTR